MSELRHTEPPDGGPGVPERGPGDPDRGPDDCQRVSDSDWTEHLVGDDSSDGVEDASGSMRRTDVDRPISVDDAILDVLRSGAAAQAPIAPGPSTSRIRPGERIDHYEIIRELGRGAMARVFLARDTKLGRRVAIKLLHRGGSAFTERFIVEARATARCNHENIVVIHEVGEHTGRPYMVLEYLEGRSLKTLLADGPLPPRRAIELITPVVHALESAHPFGIVHRDLKPDNIVVTTNGTVKVLDFGIAKLMVEPDPARAHTDDEHAEDSRGDAFHTEAGTVLGTLPYMAPEQWDSCADTAVDHRTDIWAVGITLFEMLTGTHPLEPVSRERLARTADLGEPLPSVAAFAPELPDEVVHVVDDCLAKPKQDRIASAPDLLVRLERAAAALDGRGTPRLGPDENPYAGLAPFQEADADWFFGRERDVARVVARLRDQPLVGIIGTSGAGKSSLVRAGVAAALKRSGDSWEVVILRPGRDPIGGLSGLLESLRPADARRATPEADTAGAGARPLADPTTTADIARRLRDEPGYLGAFLRRRARARRTRILLFIDQFEELYTLVSDLSERRTFTSALAGVADDPATPLRVMIAMRSDLLDRAAQDRAFLDELTRGLMFLPAPDRKGLEAALVRPAELAGYRFESQALVERMLDALDDTRGALPLLQFTAAELWQARDRDRRLLTRASYDELGGLAGALARHADAVLAGLPRSDQRLARLVFGQLVTPERTRALTALSELEHPGSEPGAVARLVDRLVSERLLIVHEGERMPIAPSAPSSDRAGEAAEPVTEPMIEIVHESLIEGWPTLRRWLEQDQEQAAFLDQLRAAARQWDARGRPPGLLWRGEAALDAARWQVLLEGKLPEREAHYLDAVLSLSQRAARMRRLVIAGALAVSTLVAIAAVVAALWIRNAEKQATWQAELLEQKLAELEARKREAQRAQRELRDVNTALEATNTELAESQRELEQTVAKLEGALSAAKAEQDRAERESERARLALRDAQRAREQAEHARSQAEFESERARQAATAERLAAESARRAAEEARIARENAEALARDLRQAQAERARRQAEEADRRRRFEEEWGPFRDTLE